MDNIILAIIGSGALSALVAGIFNLIINRKGRLGIIEGKIDQLTKRQEYSEKDALRTQLLLMMSDYPDERQEIMRLAERYFSPPPKGLAGNWYATALFNKWLIKNKIAKPEWFHSED